MGFFFAISCPPSADSAYMSTTNSKQDILKQPEANTDLLNFSRYYKSSVETNFPIFAIVFSHYDYRANMS